MKILASDYDGTLLTKDMVSAENVEAIHRFRKAGNAFGIVTGRSLETIRQEIYRNHLEIDFLIVNNGGTICDQNYNKIKESLMDFDKAMELVSYIRTLHCGAFSINDGSRRYRIVIDKNMDVPAFHSLKSTLTWEEIQKEKRIAQIVITLGDAADAEKICEYINRSFDGYATAYMNVGCIDIVPFGVSKGNGLRYVEEWKGYCHEDVYAIGDSFNDISMIKEFHGFSVSHALPQITQHAKRIVNDVSDAIAFLM